MLRKMIFAIFTVFMIVILSVGMNAAGDYIIPNPPLTAEVSSPVIDGDIAKNEGWSDAVYMNEDTLSFADPDRQLTILGEVYFAIDRQGFYFAADITEGVSSYDPDYGFTDSEITGGLISSDIDHAGNYLRDGDYFLLGIDVMDIIRDYGYTHKVYHSCPCYQVCFYENGELQMFDNYGFSDDPNITDKVMLQGFVTAEGWCFEAYIPWNIIIEDLNRYIQHTFSVSAEDIVSDSSVIRVGAGYIDRSILTSENDLKVIYNKFATIPQDYYESSDYIYRDVYHREALGIEITVSDLCRGYGHRWSDWITVIEPTYFCEGTQLSVCRLCGEYRYKTISLREYSNGFDDVKITSWYAKGVEYCVKRGYMSGMGNGRFSPNLSLTREQCVVILANILEVDYSRYAYIPSDFTDVPTNRWYSGAITWAVQQGYVKGMSEGVFGLGQPIQRAAFARLLYLLAQDLDIADVSGRADLTKYTDHSGIPSWAYEALAWAVNENIVTSTKEDKLVMDSVAPLKRAQCATMLMQFGKLLEAEGFYDYENLIIG